MSESKTARQLGAERSREALLDAAAAAFVETGGASAGPRHRQACRCGCRHCVSALPDARRPGDRGVPPSGRGVRRTGRDVDRRDVPPTDALCRWTSAFTDFLVTKHGLSDALSSDDPSLNNLHALIFDSLVPAFASLVERAQESGEVSKDVSPVTFLRAIGNLCIVGPGYTEADAKAMVGLLLAGSGATTAPPAP